jgi:hypothetical protein
MDQYILAQRRKIGILDISYYGSHYIQKEIRKNSENYGQHLFEVYRNNLLGLDEMIRKLWTIVDSPRTDSKEKIKAVVLIGQYYRERLELVRSEPYLIQRKQYMDSVRRQASF